MLEFVVTLLFLCGAFFGHRGDGSCQERYVGLASSSRDVSSRRCVLCQKVGSCALCEGLATVSYPIDVEANCLTDACIVGFCY